ncbi:MAG: aminoglycoside phosphotransferase [Ruminococcaceae bacterium]|nr:aminoglycoside phosphotransferase [Oscillospiraceae bacterium]
MNLDRVIAVRNNKTIFRDGDRCIKVFNPGHSKSEIFSEALNQARMEELGINVPKLLEVTTIDGKWGIVSEYVKGKTLAMLMEERPQDVCGHLELLAELQKGLHKRECVVLGDLKERMKRDILSSELESDTKLRILSDLDGVTSEMSVCHCDLEPSNVIISKSGTPYLIDWACSAAGDRHIDVAYTYLLLHLKRNEREADLFLDISCQGSGSLKEAILKMVPVVAASALCRGNERERMFFSKWLEPRH